MEGLVVIWRREFKAMDVSIGQLYLYHRLTNVENRALLQQSISLV